MKVRFIGALVAAVVVACGCGQPEEGAPSGDTQATTGGSATTGSKTAGEPAAPARTLVGSWNEVGNENATSLAEFKEDGTFTLIQADKDNPAKSVKVEGTYQIEGDKVIRTFTEIEAEGATEAEKAELRKTFEGFKDKPQPGTLEWVSDTEIKFTDDSSKVTTTWKKS